MPVSAIPPVAPIAAYRDAAGQHFLNQDSQQFPRDVLPNMIKVNPEQYRFLTVVSRFGQSGKSIVGGRKQAAPEVQHPYQFEWYLRKELPTKVQLSAAALVGDTSLTFVAGHTSRITTGQNLVNIRTGERVRLSFASGDIGATTVANITRSVGATPAQACNAGDEFVIMTSSRSEASADPVPIGFKPELAYNYTSESALAAGATMKMMTSKQYAGWGPDADQKAVADYFRYQLEMDLLFSELEYLTASDNYILTRTQGLVPALQTNVQVWQNTPDWPTFISLIYPYVRYGSGGVNGSRTKHLFASRSWMNWINTLPTQHVVVNDPKVVTDEESGMTWGWQVSRLYVNGVTLILHPMYGWDEMATGALNMAQSFLIVDANHIGVRYREHGRPALLPARGPNGRAPNNVTYETVCWHADQGLQYDFDAAHGIVTCPAI